MEHEMWRRVAAHTGHQLNGEQINTLSAYRGWLLEEALPAGGLGPSESSRLDERHIADSLLFASPMPQRPSTVTDLGSGVGLPGIPLAILLPETRLRLVDRSGRRVDLLKRVVRVLELENVVIEQMDIAALEETTDVMVSRATIPPLKMQEHAKRLLNDGGIAILGGSWRESPSVQGWETVQIPAEVLDRSVWLLIMRHE